MCCIEWHMYVSTNVVPTRLYDASFLDERLTPRASAVARYSRSVGRVKARRHDEFRNRSEEGRAGRQGEVEWRDHPQRKSVVAEKIVHFPAVLPSQGEGARIVRRVAREGEAVPDASRAHCSTTLQ